jgi:uncharacterized protein
MLHRVEIENFTSIRDPQVIDLRVGAPADDSAGCLAPLWRGAHESAPKVVALFGANASGKTNVLRALSFITWFAEASFYARLGAELPFERFNDAEMLKAPTRLAVHFGGPAEIGRLGEADGPQCGYAYEVVIGPGPGTPILRETLSYRPDGAVRRIALFERRGDGHVAANKAFGLSGYRQALSNVLRPEASVISTLAQLKHPAAMALAALCLRANGNIFVDRLDDPDESVIRLYAARPHLIERFNREVARIDLGLHAMEVQVGPRGPVASFRHHGLAAPMPLHDQSHGTRQFLKLFPLLAEALDSGGIVLLDELDAAIHPMLLPEIVRWFHDPERNPHDAQLWMTCHSASLLEDLTKEEVLFCDKDARGRTQVYGLRDIQAVRRTDNFYKKYLGGAFGAVPQIG